MLHEASKKGLSLNDHRCPICNGVIDQLCQKTGQGHCSTHHWITPNKIVQIEYI